MLTSKSIVTTILSMMTKFAVDVLQRAIDESLCGREFIPLALRTVGSKSGITDTTQSLRQNSV